jgi:proteasome subunit B (beta)-like protein
MTIIIGITTPDGVILASDSRTTQLGGRRILSDSAQKVFAIESFGVATTGAALISENTIAGLMDQFVAQLGQDEAKDFDRFTDALGRFFDSRFLDAWVAEMEEAAAQSEVEEDSDEADEANDGDSDENAGEDGDDREGGDEDGEDEDEQIWDTETFGYGLTFLVAGYDAEGIGHIHEVKIPGPDRGDYSPNTAERGTIWRGQTDVITRMLSLRISRCSRSRSKMPSTTCPSSSERRLTCSVSATEQWERPV